MDDDGGTRVIDGRGADAGARALDGTEAEATGGGPDVDDRAARPRGRRGLGLASASALASVAAAGVGVAAHYARRRTDPPALTPEDPPRADEQVTIHAIDDGHVFLAGDGADRPGVWGVTTPGAYARIGAAREHTPAGVRRPVVVLAGDLVPDHGVLDAYAHPNRATSLHPDAVEVSVIGDLGAMPAHHVPGDDTWAIGVHGRAAARHETFRALDPIVAAGHSALAISYRNDQDAPPSPDGRSHLGGTEWGDLAAAMDHARRHGATRIILVGCSMGGAIVGQALAHADVHDVVAVVLDAPVVDWHPVVARAARSLGIPGIAVTALLVPTRAVARSRHRVDLDALRFDTDALSVPTLLVHGVADDVVPVEGSDELATRRADVVTYLRVPDAGHVRAWNADPATYEAAVSTLLARVTRARDRARVVTGAAAPPPEPLFGQQDG